MSENLVVDACIKWLLLNKYYVWRNNSGAYKTESGHYVRYGLKGSADILGLTPKGQFIAVECKFGTNKLQLSQEAFRDKVLSCNGIYIVAYSVDDLEKELKK